MKKIFLILFTVIVFFVSSKPVFSSCDYDCQTQTPGYSLCNNPGSPCYDCQFCVDYRNPNPTPEPGEDTAGKITNPFLTNELNQTPGKTYFQNLLKTGISFAFVIGAIIFLFMLIWGAIRWLSSSGDKAKLETAQKQISSALIGLVILLSVFAIMQLLEKLFGISLLRLTLPTMSN